jgi:hypothetical protein
LCAKMKIWCSGGTMAPDFHEDDSVASSPCV